MYAHNLRIERIFALFRLPSGDRERRSPRHLVLQTYLLLLLFQCHSYSRPWSLMQKGSQCRQGHPQRVPLPPLLLGRRVKTSNETGVCILDMASPCLHGKDKESFCEPVQWSRHLHSNEKKCIPHQYTYISPIKVCLLIEEKLVTEERYC